MILTQKCKRCNSEKDISLFRARRFICISCEKLAEKNWRKRNAEKIKESKRVAFQKKRAALAAKTENIVCKLCGYSKPPSEMVVSPVWCKMCRLKRNRIRKEELYAAKGKTIRVRRKPGSISVFQKALEDKERREKYIEKNREQILIKNRICQKKSRASITLQKKERRHRDVAYNTELKLRSRISAAFKLGGAKKNTKSEKLLGCSFEDFRVHLKSLFTQNMTWDKVLNGEIVLDHIAPCCLFDLVNEEEQFKCFNYKNVQPLWKLDNLIKNDRYMGMRCGQIPKCIKQVSKLTEMSEELYNMS